jgi:hypothetical protein
MPYSTNQDTPDELANGAPTRRRPNLSQVTSAARRHFSPLSIEETITYRKWRRTTLIFYGALACIATAFLIAIDPTSPSTNVRDRDSYSALASVGHRNPR